MAQEWSGLGCQLPLSLLTMASAPPSGEALAPDGASKPRPDALTIPKSAMKSTLQAEHLNAKMGALRTATKSLTQDLNSSILSWKGEMSASTPSNGSFLSNGSARSSRREALDVSLGSSPMQSDFERL